MPAEEPSKPPGSVRGTAGGVQLSPVTRTGNSLASLRRLSPPARYSLHQLKTRLALTPCARATRATDAPSANASPTIRCFSSSDRYCRFVVTGCVYQHLGEHKESSQSLGHEILEIAKAVVLAVVAIATAGSGYQAALWTGHQAELYGQSSKLRVQAEGSATYANQERLYNASTVVEWLKAEARGDKKLAVLFERRFLPAFRPAFEAWKKTDPLNNPNAPQGPQFMAEYRSSKTEEAANLNDQATAVFEQGTRDRQHSDEYVRVTVTVATVLLLMVISQRFKTRAVRLGLLVIAAFLLCFLVYRILLLPRA